MTETASPSPPAPEVDGTGITEIADGIWVIPDRRVPLVPNIGIVVGDDTVLVVDTGMGPRSGTSVLAAAREKAAGRRLLLTLTHFHPEHGFGAQAFRKEATIAYNRAQLDELREKGEAYVGMFRTFSPAVAEALEGVELVEPHLVYEGDAEIDLGGRTVALRSFGCSHTRGDQVVLCPDAGVLFTGDLVESRMFPIYPYFPPDDADVDGSRWIEVLRCLEALDPRIVVPGHGEIGDSHLISVAREYHEMLRAESFRLSDEGASADEAVAALEQTVLDAYPGWDQPEWIGFGIRCFHAERGTPSPGATT
jgi:glyoxylase-like metal-dependent hydrolase (beta-lactamase superfamily II)